MMVVNVVGPNVIHHSRVHWDLT